MNEPNLKDLLSIGEAAEVIGVSEATLRRWDRSGKFKAIKHPITNFRLYRREDLQAFLRLLDPKVNFSVPQLREAGNPDSPSPERRKDGSLNRLRRLKKGRHE